MSMSFHFISRMTTACHAMLPRVLSALVPFPRSSKHDMFAWLFMQLWWRQSSVVRFVRISMKLEAVEVQHVCTGAHVQFAVWHCLAWWFAFPRVQSRGLRVVRRPGWSSPSSVARTPARGALCSRMTQRRGEFSRLFSTT